MIASTYFTFGCVGSLLLHAGFLQLRQVEDYSSLRCAGFSLWWLLLLWSMGSRRMGFSSCGMQAQQLWLTGSRAQAQQLWRTGLVAHVSCGMWDLPRPGLEPVSPALAGRFLTTAPPGKSLNIFLNVKNRKGFLYYLIIYLHTYFLKFFYSIMRI